MRYGLSLPPFEDFFNPRTLAQLAREAELAGWDGFFLWDHVLIWPTPIADPWIALTAIALATEKLRIGPLVTPIPRRRPIKLLRETITLDHLSSGRLVLGVGSGAGRWEYDYLGEEGSPNIRAEMLDEALELLTKAWTGEPILHAGPFYRLQGDLGPDDPTIAPTPVLPKPIQQPRIPIWVAASWPNKAPFRRAARWDGVVPLKLTTDNMPPYLTPEDTHAIVAYCLQQRDSPGGFDVVISGHTTNPHDTSLVRAHQEAGATWWLEDISPWPFGWQWQGSWPVNAMQERITLGPPRLPD